MSTILDTAQEIHDAALVGAESNDQTTEEQIIEAMQDSLNLIRVQVNQLFRRYAEEFPRTEVSIVVDGYGCYTSEGNTLSALDEALLSGNNIEIAKFVLRLRSAIDPEFQQEYHSKYKELINQLRA